MSDAARGAGTRVELTGLRRGTVRSMSVSATVPQFTLQRDVPTAGLRELRKTLKSGSRRATLTDVITMACARALREHPGVNASYGDDCVIVHERVNIGLALALDDGLTVPVILDADALGLEGLAVERLRLAEAARTRALRAEEIFAGTFSISNLGPLGVDRFQALVLPPQAAILAVGSLRDTVSLSGSFDHRAVDGAPAARFLATIAKLLAEPAWALAAPEGAELGEARAQRRCDARQVERGPRAGVLPVGRAEPGLAGGDVIAAAGLVVQGACVAQVLDGCAGPVEGQQRIADVLLTVGDGEVAVQRRIGAAGGLQALQRLVLAAEARQHDAEAVVADRDVAGPAARLEHGARGPDPDERGVQLAGLGEGDADLAIADRGGATITDRQVLLAVALELFDAAEGVWHRTGPTCALPSPSRTSGQNSRYFYNLAARAEKSDPQ